MRESHQEIHKVSLETLGGGPGVGKQGAAVELFNAEFQKVLDNICDENTKPDAVREVKLTVKMKPDKNRAEVQVEIGVSSKLASFMPYPTRFYVGKQGGVAVAQEDDPQQKNIFRQIEEEKRKQAEEAGNVITLPTINTQGKDE